MKPATKFFLNLFLSTLALILTFALMLHFHTAPVIAFAYLLFFITLRSITTFTLTRDRILQLAIASILCIAASFWTLTSNTSMLSPREDASPYSILWRSILILLCLIAIPHYASKLAIKPLRRPIS